MICDLVFFSLKEGLRTNSLQIGLFKLILIVLHCRARRSRATTSTELYASKAIGPEWPEQVGLTYILNKVCGQWLWYSWQNGSFRKQRFVVRIQSSYFLFSVNCHEKIKINKNCAFKKQCSRPKSRLDFFLIHLSASMNSVRVFPL